jgi:threonine synthase
VIRNEIDKNETVVCLVTGSGFKDMGSIDRNFNLPEVSTMGRQESISAIEQFF